MSASVTAIDTAHRKVTLLGPDGDKVTVKVGPEAVNFDYIQWKNNNDRKEEMFRDMEIGI